MLTCACGLACCICHTTVHYLQAPIMNFNCLHLTRRKAKYGFAHLRLGLGLLSFSLSSFCRSRFHAGLDGVGHLVVVLPVGLPQPEPGPHPARSANGGALGDPCCAAGACLITPVLHCGETNGTNMSQVDDTRHRWARPSHPCIRVPVSGCLWRCTSWLLRPAATRPVLPEQLQIVTSAPAVAGHVQPTTSSSWHGNVAAT